ncbi:hypothetical protein [Mesorhizobium huakuii]|uniref:Uncharacterized protein n=1 Tax=Mesorhizobium huakuii TaxID=28104 RepID=A0ABZ0VZ80_9HYPH|nr:hypothetical protein [Mesorhizobium huakuii]WQC02601.1 hypothetical protein U0R22_006852 [Mesorhizobium huakuii]
MAVGDRSRQARLRKPGFSRDDVGVYPDSAPLNSFVGQFLELAGDVLKKSSRLIYTAHPPNAEKGAKPEIAGWASASTRGKYSSPASQSALMNIGLRP